MQPNMRVSPSAAPNPIRSLRDERKLRRHEFAELIGITERELSLLETGRESMLYERYRPGFSKLGYDFDALRRQYAEWCDAVVRGGGEKLVVNDADDLAKRIASAITDGFRGETRIAHASGAPVSVVRAYLRTGTI